MSILRDPLFRGTVQSTPQYFFIVQVVQSLFNQNLQQQSEMIFLRIPRYDITEDIEEMSEQYVVFERSPVSLMLSGIVINVLYPFPYFKFQSGGQIGFPVQSEIFVFEEKGSQIGTSLLMWKVLLVKELLLYFSFLAHSIISDRSPVCGSLVCN